MKISREIDFKNIIKYDWTSSNIDFTAYWLRERVFEPVLG